MDAVLNSMELLKTAGVAASSVLSIWGVCRIWESAARWIRKRHRQPMDSLSSRLERMEETLARLDGALLMQEEALAGVQWQLLNRFYLQYVEKEKACPIEVKQSIEDMYRQYVKDGKRNHVASDYLDRLMALPVKGERH